MSYRGVCRHCYTDLVQHPSGQWVPTSDPSGSLYCQENMSPGFCRVLHEPMPVGLKGAPIWSR